MRSVGAPIEEPPAFDPDIDADPDDPDADLSGQSGAELLARELGARIIDEIPREDG